jgi:hypothetical protein
MNKNLLIGLFTLICSVFAFTACSDDDEEKVNYAGTYSGQLEVTIGENAPIPSEQSITLAEIDNGYQLQLVNFAIAGITVEKIEVPVSITETGAVSGSATDVPVFLTVTADVTISGTIIDNAANLTINVSAPLTPGGELTEMIVKFNGTKQ